MKLLLLLISFGLVATVGATPTVPAAKTRSVSVTSTGVNVSGTVKFATGELKVNNVAVIGGTGVSSSSATVTTTIAPAYTGSKQTIREYTLTANVTTISSPGGSPRTGDTLELNMLLSGGPWTLAGWDSIYALSDDAPTIPTTSGKMYTLLFEYSTLKTKWLLRAVSPTY